VNSSRRKKSPFNRRKRAGGKKGEKGETAHPRFEQTFFNHRKKNVFILERERSWSGEVFKGRGTSKAPVHRRKNPPEEPP